eukprot:1281259-Rhodomonas_salina.1
MASNDLQGRFNTKNWPRLRSTTSSKQCSCQRGGTVILWQANAPGPKYGWSSIKMRAIADAHLALADREDNHA